MNWDVHQTYLNQEVYQLGAIPNLDDTVLCLYYLEPRSLLHELYDVLGPKALVDLIEVLGGATLTLPTVSGLRCAIADVATYRLLERFLDLPMCPDAHEAAAKAKKLYGIPNPWMAARRVASVLKRKEGDSEDGNDQTGAGSCGGDLRDADGG